MSNELVGVLRNGRVFWGADGERILWREKADSVDVAQGGKDLAVVNVSSKVVEEFLEGWRHKPEDFVGYKTDLNPLEVMRKSRELVSAATRPEPARLTVGDLSFEKEQKARRNAVWRANPANHKACATVGDLSVEAELKQKRDAGHSREDTAKRGLTVGDLFEGPETPKPHTTESQEALMRMQAKQQENLRVKELVRRSAKGLVPASEVAAILRGEVVG
jgi:hypothetical protein